MTPSDIHINEYFVVYDHESISSRIHIIRETPCVFQPRQISCKLENIQHSQSVRSPIINTNLYHRFKVSAFLIHIQCIGLRTYHWIILDNNIFIEICCDRLGILTCIHVCIYIVLSRTDLREYIYIYDMFVYELTKFYIISIFCGGSKEKLLTSQSKYPNGNKLDTSQFDLHVMWEFLIDIIYS